MQVLQPCLQDFRFLSVFYGQYEEVNEPGEGVLIHGLDVREVGDGEEENGAVDGDGRVTHAGCVDLLLGLLSNGLQTNTTNRWLILEIFIFNVVVLTYIRATTDSIMLWGNKDQ